MKVPVYVQTRVEADVSFDDIISSLEALSCPDRTSQSLMLLNICCGLILSIPDSIISDIQDDHREIIVRYLIDQVERFKSKKDQQS